MLSAGEDQERSVDRPRIGYLTPATGGFFFGAILAGMVRAATEAGGVVAGIQTVEAQTEGTSETALHTLEGFTLEVGWSRFDAFVLAAQAVGDAYVHRLAASEKPVVLVCKEYEGLACPSVVPDNRGGIRQAIAHLVEHGHRRIGFVGNLVQSDMRERFDGYRQALHEQGIDDDPSLFFEAPDNMSLGGEEAARRILAAGVPTTALVVATDRNALALMKALTAAGLCLPDDQAIVGFDDVDEGAKVTPSLTSVRPGFDRLGELAAQYALRMARGEHIEPGPHATPAALVVRHSCGCGEPSIRVPSDGGERQESGPSRDLCRQESLRTRLGNILGVSPEGPARSGKLLSDLVAAACAVLGDSSDGVAPDTDVPPDTEGRVRSAARPLSELTSGSEATAEVVRVLHHHVQDALDTGEIPPTRRRQASDALLELSLAFLRDDVRRSLTQQTYLEVTMGAHYQISMNIFSESEGDPTRLAWLEYTDASLGCLALWPHGAFPVDRSAQETATVPSMEIVGVYGVPGSAELVGRLTDVRDFPPQALLDGIDPRSGQVLHIMSIVHGGCQRGLLATLGPVEQRAQLGRDRSNQWAALLTVALERQRNRALAAAAKERELALLEELRLSEERYTLAAQAANDGLWDWDLDTGRIYYSARWKALLGFDEEAIGSSPQEWLSRVHAEDAAPLNECLSACLSGRSETLVHEHRLLTRDGSYRWMSSRGLVVRPEIGGGRIVGSLTDVDDRRRMEEQLRRNALHDPLTGLANRILFTEGLEKILQESRAHPGRRFAVLFCDLDGFKQVNDSFGHRTGDLLLVRVAGRIRDSLRPDDVAARLGGDEFAVLLPDIAAEEIGLVVNRLDVAVRRPIRIAGDAIRVGVSIGVATSDQGYEHADDVIRDADIAMYQRKHEARHRRGTNGPGSDRRGRSQRVSPGQTGTSGT